MRNTYRPSTSVIDKKAIVVYELSEFECYDALVGIFLLGKNDAIDGGGPNMHPALASFTFARGSRTVKNRCVLAATVSYTHLTLPTIYSV